jgi:hypothetical protein
MGRIVRMDCPRVFEQRFTAERMGRNDLVVYVARPQQRPPRLT